MNIDYKTLLLWLTFGVIISSAEIHAHDETHKQLITLAFDKWEEGTGSPFDLLSPTATWTILGPTPSAGIYTIEELKQKIIEPFQERLAQPLKPKVRQIYQDEDTVIVLFEASARLKNGEGYKNSYAWFFKMKNQAIISVTAVLDLNAYEYVVNQLKEPLINLEDACASLESTYASGRRC